VPHLTFEAFQAGIGCDGVALPRSQWAMALKPLLSVRTLHRLWQPRRGLFWLMLAFNFMSSGLAWWMHLAQPEGALRVLITVLALSNTLMGWWLLYWLWREGPAPLSKKTNHAQSPVDHRSR
jgi:hypothetical protein